MHGLRRAYQRAMPHVRSKGIGVWIDPHLWFSPSLVMEANGDDPREPVGPAYHDVIPLPARSHLYHMLRALEVDLVFVERGISFRQLRRVYSVLFETYDVHGGSERIEERHFRGLTGLRVMVETLSDEEPRSVAPPSDYPEPKYDDIGRARILQVFRDRGGRKSFARRPRVTDDVPQPMLV